MPTDNGDVTFKYGTQNAYNALTTIDNNAIYVTTDTHRIYIGGVDYTEDAQMNANTKQYVDSVAATIDSRVNNIIANNNDTEGNSELIDIRGGADGTTYTSAGEAIRSQLARNNDTILQRTGHSNLFDKTKFTPDCEFQTRTLSVIENNQSYGLSDFIPVLSCKTLYFSRNGTATNATYIYAFDANQAYVDASIRSNSSSYTVPETANYIRVCIKNNTIEDFQIEYDSVTDYKNYTDLGVVAARLADVDSTISCIGNTVNGTLRSRNRFDKSTWLNDKELNINTGQPKDNSRGYGLSDFIPVQQGETLAFSVDGSSFAVTYVYAFTNGKSYISGSITSSVTTYSVPNGVSYIRICIRNNSIEKFQVEQNSITDYVPYSISSDDLFNTIKTVQENFPDSANPLANIENYPSFISCFRNVGCIGDSLASGVAVYKDSEDNIVVNSVARYEYSWGQYLARMTGNTYYNWSAGGLRTDSWLSSNYAAECFDGNHLCQAYIIGLGQNDNNHSNGSDLGTSADIDTSDYNNNADSFYGRYGKIIQKIKEVQPKAKIFVITDPNDSVNTNGYNAAISDIANMFDNVYLLDMRTYWSGASCAELLESQKRYGHYNAVGYFLIAKMIMTYIDHIIQTNLNDFREIENIGTDYHWYDE